MRNESFTDHYSYNASYPVDIPGLRRLATKTQLRRSNTLLLEVGGSSFNRANKLAMTTSLRGLLGTKLGRNQVHHYPLLFWC